MKREYYQKYELVTKNSNFAKPSQTSDFSEILPCRKSENTNISNFFENIGYDEILIAALIIALATDEHPDFLTICALIFILLT